MQTLRKADEVAWADNVDFEAEHKDSALAELEFSIAGTWTGGSGTIAQDAALKILGRLEFNHNGPRVSCDPRLLYYNSVFHDRGVRELSAAGTTTGTFLARFNLPFQRVVPRGGIDAVARVAAWKGRFRSGTYLMSVGATIATSTRVRAAAVTGRTAPAGGFRDPEYRQETVRCDQSSVSANSRRIEFKSDVIVPYLLLMALDFDGDTSGLTDRSLRTDGLVQRLTIERFGSGGEALRLVDDVAWGTLRAMTSRLAQWSAADVTATAGIVVVPLVDPNERDGLLRMPAGSHLTVTCDTASTVEAGYTDVTPAAGDTVEMFVPQHFANERETPRRAATLAETSAVARQRTGRGF